MSKVKGYLRRFLACVMICFTLSFTAAGDYLDIQEFQVYATGLEIGMLEALIEAILASMGISLSSQADLSSVAQGLSSVMKQYTDYEVGGVKIFPLITEVFVNTGSNATSWGMPAVCEQWLRTYLYNQCVSNISSACDVVNPVFQDSGIETTRVAFSDEIWNDVFYGYDVVYGSTPITFNSTYYTNYDAPLMVTWLNTSGVLEIATFDYKKNSFILLQDVSDVSTLWSNMQLAYTCNYYSGSTLKYQPVASAYFTYSADDEAFVVSSNNYGFSGTGTWCFRSRSGTIGKEYCPASFSDVSNYMVKIYLNSNTEVYSSVAEYEMLNFASICKPASRVYGLSSTAKPFEKDESTGMVSIPFDSAGITAKVEQAISSAIAANPSITEEELNAAASDVIAAQNGTTEAVNQNTATLSALLTSILATVRGIADSVSKISVDGGAGALDWSDVQDAFGTTTVEPGTSDSDSDNDDDGGKPNVWVPGVVAGVSLLLKPLIEFLGEPLSVVTQFQSAILGQLEGAQEWIMDIPEAISVALNPALTDILEGVLSLPVTGIYEGILALPGDIADALSNGLSIDIPDVVFPDLDIIDYTSLLDRIIELLESFFLLDTAAIAAALGGFEKVWEEKLPFGNKMFSLFNEFYFSPNYNYPVIKVKTPDIIRTFYPEEYIILCDFEEYKVYCLWARNIIKAWLWFCFGLSIFSHLKTNFHIG